MKPTFIEVCAGAGGLSSGLIQAGFTPLLLNDTDSDCVETLKKNHDCPVFKGDFRTIEIDTYKKADLICGGVPCQSFSQAGLRKGLDDSKGDLMLDFINIINTVKPKVFLIENVKGLLNHDKGKTFSIILQELNKTQEYKIKYECLNSLNYSVPQKRERVIIIGVRKDLNRDYQFPAEIKPVLCLKDVLKNVPPSNGPKYPQKKIDLFKLIPPGGCWVNLPVELQKEYMGKSYYSGGGKRGILYRLSYDKPCLTLLCSPSQKQTERCHPDEERPLTTREYARIQTFDDDYNFVGSLSSVYKQIGNAVPVNFAKHIGLSIKAVLV